MKAPKRIIIGLLTLALTGFTALASGPVTGGVYDGPGIVVTNFSFGNGGAGITVVDNGAVVCDGSPTSTNTYGGNGGVCLPFETLYHPQVNPDYRDALEVLDGQYDAVFQVCVDNNQDNLCRGAAEAEGRFATPPASCAEDTILYSHDSRSGANHNPLYIPDWVEDFWRTCNPFGPKPNAWGGYIVIVCAGAHDNEMGTNAHTHLASSGFVRAANAPDRFVGDYCGAPTAVKGYLVT